MPGRPHVEHAELVRRRDLGVVRPAEEAANAPAEEEVTEAPAEEPAAEEATTEAPAEEEVKAEEAPVADAPAAAEEKSE